MVMDPNSENLAAARLNPSSYVPVQPFVMPQQVQLPPGETSLPYLSQQTADNVLKHRLLFAEKEKPKKRFATDSVSATYNNPVGLGLSSEEDDGVVSLTQNDRLSTNSKQTTQESAMSSKNNDQQEFDEEEDDDEEYVPPQDDNGESVFQGLENHQSQLTGLEMQQNQQQKQREEDDALVESFLNEDLF